MTSWIESIYRIVVAVCVKVKSVYSFIISIIYVVLRNKSTNGWVIISRFEIVKTKFGVVIISTISYWV